MYKYRIWSLNFKLNDITLNHMKSIGWLGEDQTLVSKQVLTK